MSRLDEIREQFRPEGAIKNKEELENILKDNVHENQTTLYFVTISNSYVTITERSFNPFDVIIDKKVRAPFDLDYLFFDGLFMRDYFCLDDFNVGSGHNRDYVFFDRDHAISYFESLDHGNKKMICKIKNNSGLENYDFKP